MNKEGGKWDSVLQKRGERVRSEYENDFYFAMDVYRIAEEGHRKKEKQLTLQCS